MNERPRNDDERPELSPGEVIWLITRAMTEGVASDVDYADIQLEQPLKPQFYILELDPAIVQRHKRELGVDLEEVRAVLLEFDDPRLLYEDGPMLPAKLAITIESYVYNDVDPSSVYTKDVVYTLSITANAQWEVMESYYDATVDGYRLVNQDLVESGEEKADDARAINEADLAILRLFI